MPDKLLIPLEELKKDRVDERYLERVARATIMSLSSSADGSKRRRKLEKMVEKKIGKKSKWLVDKLFELAEGVFIIDKQDPHGIRYYQSLPDREAIKYLLDRLLGRPTERVEDKTDKPGLVLIETIIKQLAGSRGPIGSRSYGGNQGTITEQRILALGAGKRGRGRPRKHGISIPAAGVEGREHVGAGAAAV